MIAAGPRKKKKTAAAPLLRSRSPVLLYVAAAQLGANFLQKKRKTKSDFS